MPSIEAGQDSAWCVGGDLLCLFNAPAAGCALAVVAASPSPNSRLELSLPGAGAVPFGAAGVVVTTTGASGDAVEADSAGGLAARVST